MFTPFARAAAATGLVLALAGCTSSANWMSIFRTADLESGVTLITDAKQRVVINVPARGANGFNIPTRIVCAEPSPDVAQALSDSISAAIKVEVAGKGGGSAAFGRSTAEAVAQLGERLGTIQLLRDGLYRACEAYANGAITRTTYSMIISRYDNAMVTLLLGELAAGAFGRSGAVISAAASGAAQAGGGAASETAIKDFQEKQKALDEAEETVSKEKKKLDEDLKKTDPTVIENQKTKVAAAEATRDEAKDKRDLALKVLAGSVGAATSARGLGGQAMGAIKTAAAMSKEAGAVLQGMHKAFLENDERDFSPLVSACVSALEKAKMLGDLPPDDLKDLNARIDAVVNAIDDSTKSNAKRALESKLEDLSFSGLTQLAITCRTKIMPQVVEAMKAAPGLKKEEIEEKKAKTEAKTATALKDTAKIVAKVSKDVTKAAKNATEAAEKAQKAASAANLRAKMDLCLKSLEKAANQEDALKTLKACFEKIP